MMIAVTCVTRSVELIFEIVGVRRAEVFPQGCGICSKVSCVGTVNGFVDVMRNVFERTFDVAELLVCC
jgi:hypothetical protein